MLKSKTDWTEAKIALYFKKGRGKGLEKIHQGNLIIC